MVGALNNIQFTRLCNIIGRPELSLDERFNTNPLRVKNRSILIPLLQEEFSKKTTKEWEELLHKAEVPSEYNN
jgi:crotonobetainyl-CoA:carnitine CoA-transferase CaiB-like acyl-CoA transferase